MKAKPKTVIQAIFFCSLILICISATSQDKAEVRIHLNVEAIFEEHFLAGDPPKRVNTTSDISFTHSELYTISRIKTGGNSQYMAVRNLDSSGPRDLVPNLKVIQTHPCQDGQSLLIGQFWPVEIDLEASDCSNSQCVNGFGFNGIYEIGADPESSMEDEDGYEEISGYELLEVDFQLLRNLGTGSGDIPLTIPISIDKAHNEIHETPTGPVELVYNFRVTGWIGAPTAEE